MRRFLLFLLAAFAITLTTHADVLGEYSFEGMIGDNIPAKIKFCVNGDCIAVGEIYYPKAKTPAPILLVGNLSEDTGSYELKEYQADGTITGIMTFKIDGEDDGDGPRIVNGRWTHPRTGRELKMKNMRSNGEFVDVPSFLDYEDPQNIGREYSYSIWNREYKSMMGGNVKFSGAGKYKLHFEVCNCPHNIAEGKSAPNRPAVLGESTHDFFYYDDVNECGYGFSAHFFKKFVVLKTTSGYNTLQCFGVGATFDGVYIKVKQ